MNVKMVIKITQELNAKKTKKSITCYDLPTLIMIVGSSAVGSNLNMYGVVKEENKYVIDIKKLKERLSMLKERKKKLDDTITLMTKILR